MVQLRNLVVALAGFATLVVAAPTVDLELSAPSTLETRETPCRCYAGTYAWLCGFQRDASPGHLTGDCNPNNVYLCIGGGGTAAMTDCPALGLSCKSGALIDQPGHDYCDH